MSDSTPVVRVPKWSMSDASVLAAAIHLERERIVRVVPRDYGEELPTHPRVLVLPDAVLGEARHYRALMTVAEVGGTVIRAASEKVGPFGDAAYWARRGFSAGEIAEGMHPWKRAAREGAARLVVEAEAAAAKAREEAAAIRAAADADQPLINTR